MATTTEELEDHLLQFAIDFAISGIYPSQIELITDKKKAKDKKRAIHRKAATLAAEKSKVYLQRQHRRVKVVTTKEEQKRILHACHCDPTSGHFGVTKTWRRVAERFYWRGMCEDVRELVSN